MTSLLAALPPARRRAEGFAAALDGARTDARTSALVGIADRLRATQPVVPRPEFVAQFRGRLMAEASTVLTPTNATLTLPARKPGARERRWAAAAAAFVLVGGSAGMAVAADSSLPGQALYPVKRGIEQAQAHLSITSAGRGHALLGQADTRLAEVKGLLAAGSTDRAQVPSTLDAFTSQAHQGTGLLLASYRDSRNPASVVAVRRFTAHALGTLVTLQPQVPAAAHNELARAANTLQRIDLRASRLCASCAASLPPLRMPPTVLTAAQVDRALARAHDHHLNNSHPVVVDTSTLRRVLAGHRQHRPGSTTSPDHTASGSGVARTQSPTEAPSGAPGTSSAGSSAPGGDASSNLPGTGTATTTVGKTVKKTIHKSTDQLGDLTQTLLPDPTLLP
jgi:hypothetical protein